MNDKAFDLVTGSAGFIGSHICRALLRRGRRVKVVDNLSTGTRKNLLDVEEQFDDSLEFIQADIRDLDEMRQVVDGVEDIYHQAAVASVQRSLEDPLLSNGVNVEGTLNLMVVAREAGVRKFVFASSSSIYGESESLPKRESMRPLPISPYAVTKYVAEMYGEVFTKIHKLPTLGLRYFNVFGPHQDPASEYAAVVPRFVTRMLRGEPPIIYGDGEQTRDFTYIENVVEANLAAAASEAQGISINIACGESVSLNQLVDMLNEILRTDLTPDYQPARSGDIRHSMADIEQAESKIGFVPSVSVREGLRRTVEWFQKQSLDPPEEE